jgi:uncharacterized protein YecE (DUF72 family)
MGEASSIMGHRKSETPRLVSGRTGAKRSSRDAMRSKASLYTSSVKNPARILLGTSSFTAPGWEKAFYPPGFSPRDYLSYYARHYATIEIDSTFYSCPSPATVNGWNAKTPDDFIFAVKVPQSITHEKMLAGCQPEMDEFIGVMSLLGKKLGPMVLQFPYFNQKVFKTPAEFLARLGPFLKCLPPDKMFALEIRNKNWLTPGFADLLREHNVALVLQDQSWMPGYAEIEQKFDPITANWTYIRWLGDRKGIEEITKTWEKTVVDRTDALRSWVDVCFKIQKRGVTIFAYANNHYSGFAPDTLKKFLNLWGEKDLPHIEMPDATGVLAAVPSADDPVKTQTRKGTRKTAAAHTKSLFD